MSCGQVTCEPSSLWFILLNLWLTLSLSFLLILADFGSVWLSPAQCGLLRLFQALIGSLCHSCVAQFIQPCESLKLVVLNLIFLILTSKILPSSGDDHSALLALRLLQGLRSRLQSLNIIFCCGNNWNYNCRSYVLGPICQSYYYENFNKSQSNGFCWRLYKNTREQWSFDLDDFCREARRGQVV